VIHVRRLMRRARERYVNTASYFRSINGMDARIVMLIGGGILFLLPRRYLRNHNDHNDQFP